LTRAWLDHLVAYGPHDCLQHATCNMQHGPSHNNMRHDQLATCLWRVCIKQHHTTCKLSERGMFATWPAVDAWSVCGMSQLVTLAESAYHSMPPRPRTSWQLQLQNLARIVSLCEAIVQQKLVTIHDRLVDFGVGIEPITSLSLPSVPSHNPQSET
jgi:hypothetical protein